jgi:hypothetical protein
MAPSVLMDANIVNIMKFSKALLLKNQIGIM